MQRQKTEARLGSCDSNPGSPQSFESDMDYERQGKNLQTEDFKCGNSNMDQMKADEEKCMENSVFKIDNDCVTFVDKIAENDKGEVHDGRSANNSVTSNDDIKSPSSVRSAHSQSLLTQLSPHMKSPNITSPKLTSSPSSPATRHKCLSSSSGPELDDNINSDQVNADKTFTSLGTASQKDFHQQMVSDRHSLPQNIVCGYQTNSSHDLCETAPNQGVSRVKQTFSPRETRPNSSDSFYPTSRPETDFPGDQNQYSMRSMANGQPYSLTGDYSQLFPRGNQAPRSSKDNFQTSYGHQQISGHKSNQLQPLEKVNPLSQQQTRYPYAVQNSSRGETAYKTGDFNAQYHYPSIFDMNSNTYQPSRGYSGFNNGVQNDSVTSNRPMSLEDYGSNNPQLKHGSFNSGQLNALQNGIYFEGNYGPGYNSPANRTMTSAFLPQQNYLTSSLAQHGSNMAEGSNGSFDHFNSVQNSYNTTFNEITSMFNEFTGYQHQGFQAIE